MNRQLTDLLPTLRRIEELAGELARELPAGLARHRAQHVAALARQVALASPSTEAANDAAGSLFRRG